MPPTSSTDTFKTHLTYYKQRIDADIVAYCQQVLAATETTYGGYSRDALAAYCAILQRGGKRLRGALAMHAYAMLGGDDEQLALRAARAIEMIHAYLLVIDDICDNSHMRRGGSAAHVALADYHQQHTLFGDAAHFGEAIGMSAALAGLHLALVQIGQLPTSDTIKLAAMNNTNEHLVATIHGQFNDIFNEAVRDVDEAQVQRVMVNKTAYYSFLNPLQFGAILADADPADLGYFEAYAWHAGLGFQMTDDILGTFGNEFESGKSAQDDLREGKITLLISRTLQTAPAPQKQRLLQLLGKADLTVEEHEICKQIIEDCGALDYVQRLAEQHGQKAITALDQWPQTWNRAHVAFLRDLVAYIVHRQA